METAFEFLGKVESYIHVEVRKLYDDAELPSFEYGTPAPDRLTITYRSRRPLADLALGLIEGCADHYGESMSIDRKDLASGAETRVQFSLTRLN